MYLMSYIWFFMIRYGIDKNEFKMFLKNSVRLIID